MGSLPAQLLVVHGRGYLGNDEHRPRRQSHLLRKYRQARSGSRRAVYPQVSQSATATAVAAAAAASSSQGELCYANFDSRRAIIWDYVHVIYIVILKKKPR